MRTLLLILSYILILSSNVAVKAKVQSCGTHNGMSYTCVDLQCCSDDKGTWGCCPLDSKCCVGHCCALTDACCKETCCGAPCGPDGTCPLGAPTASTISTVKARVETAEVR